MTEETAITIPDDVRTAFMAFDDDYLAAVLRLWDCDLRDWCDPVATIFMIIASRLPWRSTINCYTAPRKTATCQWGALGYSAPPHPR